MYTSLLQPRQQVQNARQGLGVGEQFDLQLFLLGQLRSKQIALRSEFAALIPLDA